MKRSSDLRLRSTVFTLLAVIVIGIVVSQLSALRIDQTKPDAIPHNSIPGQKQLSKSNQVAKSKIELHFQQAVVMLHVRQFEYAIASLEKTLELAPQMPEAHVNMGYALLGLERYILARQYFTKAIDLRPGQANAYWGLAVSLEQSRDYDAAIGAMRTFIHLSDPAAPYQVKAQAAIWEWDELRNHLASEQ